MRNVSDKSSIQNQTIFYVQKLFPEIRAVHEIMRKNMLHSDKPQMTM